MLALKPPSVSILSLCLSPMSLSLLILQALSPLLGPWMLSKSEDTLSVDLPSSPAAGPTVEVASARASCPGLTWGLETAGPSLQHPSSVKKECPLVGLGWSCLGTLSLRQGQNNQPTALLPRILNMPLGLVCFSPSPKKKKERKNSRRPVVRAAPTGL